MDSGAWPATVYRVTKSQRQLSNWAHASVSYGFMEILLSMISEHFNDVLQFGGIIWWISLFEWPSIQKRGKLWHHSFQCHLLSLEHQSCCSSSFLKWNSCKPGCMAPKTGQKLPAFLGLFTAFKYIFHKRQSCWVALVSFGKSPSTELGPPWASPSQDVVQLLTSQFVLADCNVLFLIPATCLIHNARGGPEAPITQLSRTMSSQEGTVHRLLESPPSVFARVKLLSVWGCLYKVFLPQDSWGISL